jgi:hypothetical protein
MYYKSTRTVDLSGVATMDSLSYIFHGEYHQRGASQSEFVTPNGMHSKGRNSERELESVDSFGE